MLTARVVVLVGDGQSRGILHAYEAVGKVVDVARLGAVQLIFENGEVAGVIVHVLRYGGTAVLFGRYLPKRTSLYVSSKH